VRRTLGLTQQQLAERLFLTRNYVAKIETGAKEPSTRSVRALESLLVSSEYNQGAAGVHEEGNADELIGEIRRVLDTAVAKAAGDKHKLAWILEQLRRHVAPAAHWEAPEPLGETDNPLRLRAREMREQAAKLPAGSERNVLINAAALLDETEDEADRERAAARRRRQHGERSA